MKTSQYFIGIDVSSESFTASVFKFPDKTTFTFDEHLSNSIDGYKTLLELFTRNHINKSNCAICLESTGIYGEGLCYFLCSQGYRVAVEPPFKVKRAFEQSTHKNDKIDSQQIAEYCWRFYDELHFWSPKDEILEQINTFLSLREQFVRQLTANQNVLVGLKRKYIQTPLAISMCEDTIENLRENIKDIDSQIKELIDKDKDYRGMVDKLRTIPGVGLFLAANLLVLTGGFKRTVTSKQLASYLGICPLEYKSGKSVNRRPRSKGYGPSLTRKLLYLASMNLRKTHEDTKKYFFRKVAEGKPGKLVINNIANKLLKIICAVIRDKKSYINNYISVNPLILKSA
jgi:transposase